MKRNDQQASTPRADTEGRATAVGLLLQITVEDQRTVFHAVIVDATSSLPKLVSCSPVKPLDVDIAPDQYWRYVLSLTSRSADSIACELRALPGLGELLPDRAEPDPELLERERVAYDAYLRNVMPYGGAAEPPRTPVERWRHLWKIYNTAKSGEPSSVFTERLNQLRQSDEFSNQGRRLQVAARPFSTDPTLNPEYAQQRDQNRARWNPHTGANLPGLKVDDNGVELRDGRGRQLITGTGGQMDDHSTLLQLKRKEFTGIRDQAGKSFNHLGKQTASSVLRPITMWTESLSDITKGFTLIVKELAQVFGHA